jgi:hypothetical protein
VRRRDEEVLHQRVEGFSMAKRERDRDDTSKCGGQGVDSIIGGGGEGCVDAGV